VNQWRFCGIKGVIHNGEYFFNSSSLTGDELLHQFMHMVLCYESIGIRILGCVCDAGGKNSRLFTSLRCLSSIDDNASQLLDDCFLIRNPAFPSWKIALWFCATHQLKKHAQCVIQHSINEDKASLHQ